MRPLLLLLLAAALPACLARPPLERFIRNSRRVMAADPNTDATDWQISETDAEMLVGCWQAVDGSTTFWSPDLANMVAWQAAKAGKPMAGAQIFAAGSNLGALASLPSGPKNSETSKFAVPSICFYGVNRTAGFWAGLVLVRDPSDNIQMAQQILGWVAKDAHGVPELQGNDNTPFVTLNAWLNMDTLSVDVQNMHGNEVTGTDFDLGYLVVSEYQKTQEDLDTVLDQAGKWAKDKYGAQIDAMTGAAEAAAGDVADAVDQAETDAADVANTVGDAVDQAQADVANAVGDAMDQVDQAEADVADALGDGDNKP